MGTISIQKAKAMGIPVEQAKSIASIAKQTNEFSVSEFKTVQSLWLERWLPRSLNKMLGHHMQRHKLKAQDRVIVGLACNISGITRASGRRRVDMVVVLPPKTRRIDKDNARKSLFDALTACGAILGDSPNLLAEGFVSFARAEQLAGEQPVWGTMVVLTDME